MSRRTAAVLTLVAACLAVSIPAAAGTTSGAVRSATPAPTMAPHPLGEIPADDPRMEAYSHGNYVLRVAGFLWTIGVLGLIVVSGSGARLQALAARLARSTNLTVAITTALLVLIGFAADLPFGIYAGYIRERRYGFAHQTLAAWLGDRGLELLLALVLQPIVCVVLYGVIRRLGRGWWMAGSILAILLVIVVIAVEPVFIAPLFNTFEPLRDTHLRSDILAMAGREGIPASEVYEVDASRQSSHNNAYVAGLLGTQRIVLYDNLLESFTPREVEAVMGHEMGHFVLRHVWKTVAFLACLILPGTFLVDRLARRVIEARPVLGIASISEPSSLPLIAFLASALLFLAGPLIATFSRMQEHQADLFGLEATHDPAAAASVFLKFGRLDLDEYHVHPWIETLMYSHPSLEHRIRCAQEYARAHGLGDDGAQLPRDVIRREEAGTDEGPP